MANAKVFILSLSAAAAIICSGMTAQAQDYERYWPNSAPRGYSNPNPNPNPQQYYSRAERRQARQNERFAEEYRYQQNTPRYEDDYDYQQPQYYNQRAPRQRYYQQGPNYYGLDQSGAR